jgi:hypothetical protein
VTGFELVCVILACAGTGGVMFLIAEALIERKR